ncbi:MAG: pirin family protein [Betaproteobacteria bacterium]|nr:pirin family protein [Betaproteobacteria bacterium]
MKRILGVYESPRSHWVGDGFPVRTLFSYDTMGAHLSPFLMLDYAGPAHFAPAARPRGVGVHPHRGFETVTIVYQGELEHRDSTGSGGRIGAGDVQWMTAASGILHEEFHSTEFTRTGGTLEMVQLWVNLPARDKRAAPGYQTLLDRDIPRVDLPGAAGSVRVIAGAFDGRRGPARTFTPMEVWDVRVKQGSRVEFDVPEGHTAALVVLRGSARVNDGEPARDGQMVVLARDGGGICVEAMSETTILLLAGAPIDEPISGYGPFVMNTRAEIRQAIDDFNGGRFGAMAQ